MVGLRVVFGRPVLSPHGPVAADVVDVDGFSDPSVLHLALTLSETAARLFGHGSCLGTDQCRSSRQPVNQVAGHSDANPMATELQDMTDLDAWLDGRAAWIAEGIAQGFVASEVVCGMHDGLPLTSGEELEVDEGYDPCVPMVRLADAPGEPLIPRFGPRAGEDKEQEQ
jgi:hypothetical protein